MKQKQGTEDKQSVLQKKIRFLRLAEELRTNLRRRKETEQNFVAKRIARNSQNLLKEEESE